jgi:hypothetical protein
MSSQSPVAGEKGQWIQENNTMAIVIDVVWDHTNLMMDPG